MKDRKALVISTRYSKPNGKDVLEIVVSKYRRNFKGEYTSHVVVYTAYGALAKRFSKKIVKDNELEITYRIESRVFGENYYTTLIIEAVTILGMKIRTLFDDTSSDVVIPKAEHSKDEEDFINTPSAF